MDTALSIQSLRKTYGSTIAVDDLSLEIEPGEIFGLIGPNGAGKTTTVECLLGLRRPDAGSVQVLGMTPQDNPPDPVSEVGREIGRAHV